MKMKMMSEIITLHKWKATDMPGHYMCHCGSTGIWNMDLQKIEVLEPVPHSVYLRAHTKSEWR